MKKAIILLSGGLDSTLLLAMALKNGRECFPLSFDYNQRHRCELQAAQKICDHYNVSHQIIKIDTSLLGSSGLLSSIKIPQDRSGALIAQNSTPNTYVSARNTIFLSFAVGYAETLGADEIYYGSNALDAVYPDCRPEFVSAFQQVIRLATKQAVEGHYPELLTPLLQWDKKRIIEEALALKVPLHETFSCYDPTLSGQPCERCDACSLRREGFAAVDISLEKNSSNS